MLTRTLLAAASLAALALPAAPAWATDPVPIRDAEAEAASLAADRASILAMAGDYRVRFDMQESTPWREGYEPRERYLSGGFESVRVIEDTGTRIVLQHLLVVDVGGESRVIKHWRQDWEYQPERILAYQGPGRWVWQAVPEADRRGQWSQTVYQVDDSPRYAGYGRWETTLGVRRWRSSWTQRPLARRDAIRHPVYDLYAGINRHQLFPGGWIHWQDNTKMDLVDGTPEPVVQEYVLNTYTRFSDYDVAAADAYWAATQGYWAAVRAIWSEVAERHGGIAIAEEPEAGTVISAELLEMGDRILAGSLSESEAVARARVLIEGHTSRL